MSEESAPEPGKSVRAAPPEPAAGPLIIDAEFRLASPARRLWLRLRRHWWAVGPYLAYCAVLWGLAGLAAWLITKARP